jgi:hypothetical protein
VRLQRSASAAIIGTEIEISVAEKCPNWAGDFADQGTSDQACEEVVNGQGK